MLTEDQGRRFVRLALGYLALRSLPPDVEAQDVAGEAARRAHRGKEYDPARAPFEAWVHLVCESTLKDALRRRARRVRATARDDLAADRRAHAAHRRATEAQWARSEITARQRQVLAAYLDHEGACGVAHALGVSVKTVNSHLQEIYDALGVRSVPRALVAAGIVVVRAT